MGSKSFYSRLCGAGLIAEAAEYVLKATGGKLDALFNNGGYGQPGALEDIRPTTRWSIEANVFGWHDLTARVIRDAEAWAGADRVLLLSARG